MSIRINSNILSLNAQRRLGDATSNLTSSFNRLSSGLRINKASDDAAGLAISEALKTDSRLSSQALRNVNDGISMISIINSALDSQKSILFRMAELAEQSANGVMSSNQRRPLQAEYVALQEEFDRIASSTKFNGISLLRNQEPNTVALMAGITGASSSLLEVAAANSHRFSGLVAMISDWDEDGDAVNELGFYLNSIYTVEGIESYSDNLKVFQDFAEIKTVDSTGESVSVRFMISRLFYDFNNPGNMDDPPTELLVSAQAYREDGELSTFVDPSFQISDFKDLNLNFNFGVSGATLNLNLDISDFDYSWYGTNPYDGSIRATNIGFTNIETQSASGRALLSVKNRIEDLSKLHGEFGAVEARLVVAVNQLSVSRENFASAASQITDIDVASEAAKLTSSQILQQAASAVLAQANQQPELVLQLLNFN